MTRSKGLVALSLLWAPAAWASSSGLNLTQGVTAISRDVYDLHMTIFYICVAIGLVVFGAMFWALLHHRKSRGARPASFHESVKVEVLWTLIPFAILITMAVPATKTLIAMEDNSNADLTIQITGSQWKWHYKYFDHDVAFYSKLATPREQITNQQAKGEHYLLEVDKPLVIPTERKVRFLLTSDDVIHSWWVPAFAVKQDANPGFINEAWTRVEQPGIYRGQCAELCGKDHGFMPIVVEAKSPAEFDKWLAQQKAEQARAAEAQQQALAATMTMDELMSRGEQVYLSSCAACHQANGEGVNGVFPALKGSAIATGDKQQHINIVVHGSARNPAMQAFGKQLSLADLAAVITYERNAWGNNTGDTVQAADIRAAMQQEEGQ